MVSRGLSKGQGHGMASYLSIPHVVSQSHCSAHGALVSLLEIAVKGLVEADQLPGV